MCLDTSHARRMNRSALSAPNSNAASGIPVPATNGCGWWNVYISRIDDRRFNERGFYRNQWAAGEPIIKPRKVDTRCRHCDRRVRFTAERRPPMHDRQRNRRDGRGRARGVVWEPWPIDTDTPAMIAEANLRNRGEQLERDEIGFVRAKNYRRR